MGTESPEQFVEGSTAVDSIIDVQCCTLATFCATQKIDRIDILKIDVQGAERLVLGGARELFAAGRIALVLLEASFVPIYADQTEFDEIMNFMRKNDFALFDLYDLRYANNAARSSGATRCFSNPRVRERDPKKASAATWPKIRTRIRIPSRKFGSMTRRAAFDFRLVERK